MGTERSAAAEPVVRKKQLLSSGAESPRLLKRIILAIT
jgi:hypothetical protein